MKHSGFHSAQFEQQVQKALKTVTKILDTNRTPKLAAEIQDHQYEDKFALTEFLTNTSIAALWNVLEKMGVKSHDIDKLLEVVKEEKRTATLRFRAEDTCKYQREITVDVVTFETEEQLETTASSHGSGFFGGGNNTKKDTKTSKQKVVSKVKELQWNMGVSYSIEVYAGTNTKNPIVQVQSRSSSTILVTTGKKQTIFPEKTTHPPIDVNITWLIQNIKAGDAIDAQKTPPKSSADQDDDDQRATNEAGGEGGEPPAAAEDTSRGTHECAFKIDRDDEACKTPVRNPGVEEALHFFFEFSRWSSGVSDHFRRRIERDILGRHNPAQSDAQPSEIPSLSTVDANQVFCPVIPLLEDPTSQQRRGGPGTAIREEKRKSLLLLPSPTNREEEEEEQQQHSPLLSLGDIDLFLNEHVRSLDGALSGLAQTFAPHQLVKLVTVQEAGLVLLCWHAQDLARHVTNSIYYVEDMLRRQLVSAIGKEVNPDAFDEYMTNHFRKLYNQEYAPKPFCHAIRRPNRYPDGILSIERMKDDGIQHVRTLTRFVPGGEGASPVVIPINAATRIQMTGDRYLHGWIKHRFASSPDPSSSGDVRLVARARQFSSFMLIVGVMEGAHCFQPKDAIVVQNKDEVFIPLLLNELPTAKEFKEATASLSPEQRRFAQAFRCMQLESSVFGICVVQLKPQLEALLNLPSDALTKEIRLTQDLMSLFVEYQIPSDLLSFDGDADATPRDKVSVVRDHVKAVMGVIDDAKASQLREAEREAELRKAREIADADASQAVPSDSFHSMTSNSQRNRRRTSGKQLESGMQNRFTASFSAFVESPDEVVVALSPPTPLERSSETFAEREDLLLCDFGGIPKFEIPRVTDEGQMARAIPTVDPFHSTQQATNELDFTMIPKQLDSAFERLDGHGSVRTSVIKTGPNWEKKHQVNLLAKDLKHTNLTAGDIKSEKEKSFDLLDALSRSGSLDVACAELHVVVAVTHCFENDVIGTVVQDNIDPIEKVERTSLMVASTVHGGGDITTEGMLDKSDDLERLSTRFPALFHRPASDVES